MTKNIGIRGKLYFLIAFSLVISIATGFFTNLVSQKSIQRYRDALNEQVVLNNFFNSNRQLEFLFEEYIMNPTNSNRESYEGELGYAAAQLDILSEADPSTGFGKKVSDLKNMLISFEEKANELIGKIGIKTQGQLAAELSDVLYINSLIEYTYPKYTSSHAASISGEMEKLIVVIARNSKVYLAIMVIGSILICIIGYFIINQIISPISRISKSAVLISNQKFDIPDIKLKNHDELSQLADAFNSMKNSIREYIQKLNEHSLLQETYLKALQTQINSHFLFNTLNLISRTAYFEGAPQTIQLLDATTDILRYSLYQNEKAVSIYKEISFAETYIHIQKMRFSEQLSFEIYIDDDLEDIFVPSFILQPLIENAIVHGAYNKLIHCNILTAVLQYKDRILILVEDDGCGVDQEKLKNIFEEPSSDTGGVGLNNLRKRLQFFYRKDDMLHIYSQKDEFFRVEIEIGKEEYLWNTKSS